MVPLRTRLKNGDIVEIIRNATHKPSRDWLNFAVTSRARNKIKHLIQVEEKERAVELGKRVFDKEARRFGLNGTKLLEGEHREGARRVRGRRSRRICSRRSATARCRRAWCSTRSSRRIS